jgi:hypothetical protein
VEILTTLGVTFFAMLLKAFCVASISAGTSFTGGSASPLFRFDSKKAGLSLLLLQEKITEQINMLKKRQMSFRVYVFISNHQPAELLKKH